MAAGAAGCAGCVRVSGETGGVMLFSERSIWTRVHGIGLGGGALLGVFVNKVAPLD